MTVTHTAPAAEYPWNRNDSTGFALSTWVPLAVVLAINLLFYASGATESDPKYDAVPFNPPGWIVGVMWMVIYPMWGAARWYARQSGLAGRRRSRWVAALMIYGWIYPFATLAVDTLGSALLNAGSLALAIASAAQVRGVSKRAFVLVAPSVLWLSFATVLGFTALSYALA